MDIGPEGCSTGRHIQRLVVDRIPTQNGSIHHSSTTTAQEYRAKAMVVRYRSTVAHEMSSAAFRPETAREDLGSANGLMVWASQKRPLRRRQRR
jgi:hypothetical protein